MSLKALHLIFITASTTLAFGFAAWALRSYFTGPGRSLVDLMYAAGSLVVAGALIYYGKYFLKKLKDTSYL